MKRKLIKYFLIGFFIICIEGLTAQPPPPGGEHGTSNNQVPGGGAPIGNGTLMLLSMAGVYAILKWHNSQNENTE